MTISIQTREIQYNAADGQRLVGYFAAPSSQTPHAGIIVAPEWWGRNEYTEQRARELAEHLAARVANDIGVLELGQVVLVVVVDRAIPAGLRRRVGRAHRTYFRPGVFASVGIAGHHGVRDVMPHLDRGAHRAPGPGAVEPVADADHSVLQAVGRERRRDDGCRVEREGRGGAT